MTESRPWRRTLSFEEAATELRRCAGAQFDPELVNAFCAFVLPDLVMDSDPRPRAVVLESGAYDMLQLWPQAPLFQKLAILREVWPSKRILKERSVMAHLPQRLDCSVLILHGERARRSPVMQARRLEMALRKRGVRVEANYFPRASDSLGFRVQRPLETFLRENLIQLSEN